MSERVAIVGSRGYPDIEAVRAYVRSLRPGTVVVSGAGPRKRDNTPRHKWGVDEHAEDEALRCGLEVVSFPAEWKRPDGSVNMGAGFARNSLIAEECTRAAAFWDGRSRGTRDTIRKVRRAGKSADVIISTPTVAERSDAK